MKLIVTALLCVWSIHVEAQGIPQNPNALDARSQRQGSWTLLLNRDFEPVEKRIDATYYRLVNYHNDKPIGGVRDFYLSGRLRAEFNLLSDRPEEIYDGVAVFYREDGSKEKTIVFRKGVEIAASFYKTDGSESKWDHLNWLAREFLRRESLDSAYSYGDKALRLADKEYGREHINYATSLNFLAIYYRHNGNLLKTEALQLEALRVTEKAMGRENDLYMALANNVATLSATLGNYKRAESMLLEVLAYREKLYGKYDPMTLGFLNNLANTFAVDGNYKRAESLYLEGWKRSTERNLGMTDFLISLGGMYDRTGRYMKAISTYKEALIIIQRDQGTGMSYGLTLNSLSIVHEKIGDYQNAEKDGLEALKIIEQQPNNQNTPIHAYLLSRMAALHFRLGNSAKAEAFYAQALKAKEIVEKKNDPNSFIAFDQIASVFCEKGLYANAEPIYLQLNQHILTQIETYFPWLSEAEKDAFYVSKLPALKEFNAYCLLRHEQRPSITGEMYNNQLSTKAILLSSTSKWKQHIYASGDKKLLARFTDWENNQYKIAKLRKQGTANRSQLDSLEKTNNALEKDLSMRSEMFSSLNDKKRNTWEEIRNKLKSNEAAIEMIRVNKYGVKQVITDSSDAQFRRYKQYGLTDTAYYAALIVTKSTTSPELVIFKNGDALERRFINYYRNCISAQQDDKLSFGQFWKPIADRLDKLFRKKTPGGIHIYFSPDGVYNKLNLATIYNPATKKYLFEEYTISLVTNTKDLLTVYKEETFNKLAYLFGDPDFNFSIEDEKSGRVQNLDSRITKLPGTKTEVEAVGNLMTKSGWQPEVLTGKMALEEALKDCFKPRVLHIATHGFFFKDTTGNKNPLLRSGVLLASVEKTLLGLSNGNAEDGLLTANEAMNLNLDNTDLVVLSACETGLGDVRNGEGVYGLQRAFKVAGAKTIIMSLWKVDDEATQLLMTSFYANWLSTQNKRGAFDLAQQKLKSIYERPYYWGAFIMIGE